MSVKITFKGWKEFNKKMERYGKRAIDNMEKAVEVGAMKIQSDAQSKAPVDTHALKTSINYKVKRSGDNIEAVVGPHAANPTGLVGYAVYQEFGTSRSVHPYLGPAFLENERQLLKNIGKAMITIK